MRLTCEHELDILLNTEVSLAKDHGGNYMKLRPLLARHLLRNRLFAARKSGEKRVQILKFPFPISKQF